MASNPMTFLCQSAEFNGTQCKRQCASCAPGGRLSRKKLSEPTLEWFKDYEIRDGGDGKPGIYLREYNVRLATFNANTMALQTRLKLLFERAVTKPTPKKRKRKPPPINEAWGPGSGNW